MGLRDPTHTNVVMVAAELAHYASLPSEDVERLLEADREIEVLVKLARSEAERAAQELSMLGAVVDLRLTMSDGGVFPVFKPDADRQVGVAIGGLIDDSATPPTVGEARGDLPNVEPDQEAGRMRHRPPRPRRASPRPRSRPDPLDALPMGDSGEVALRGGAEIGPPGIGEVLPAEPPRAGMGRDAPRTAPSRGRVKPKPKPKPAAKPKPKPATPSLGSVGPGAAEDPRLPERLQRAAELSQPQGKIELDFEAVGLPAPPKGGIPSGVAAPGAPRPGTSASNMPRRSRAGNMGGSGHSASGQGRGSTGLLDALREDGVASTMLSLGITLIMSLILAVQLQRGDAKELLPPLEEELAASLNDPGAVEGGQMRAPADIEAEIEETLGDMQRSFLLWWLALGGPVGLLLSRLEGQ